MHISTRLIGSQGILVAIVIRLIATADTSRFKRVEDRKCVSVINIYWRYRRVLVGLNSSSGVIIVVMRVIKWKKEALIYRLY